MDNYALATELDKKSELVQVGTLFTEIGEEAHKAFSTFDWTQECKDRTSINQIFNLLSITEKYPLSALLFQSSCSGVW